jgi:hypothetical protein
MKINKFLFLIINKRTVELAYIRMQQPLFLFIIFCL